MRRANFLIFFFLLINISRVFAEAEITCKVRYIYQVYHPPVPQTYHESKTLGRSPIAGTGKDGYYENKWSDEYTINVKFYSGAEINNLFGSNNYYDKSIVAVVNWNNGGTSLILIDAWETNLKIMTKDEIRFNAEGERIRFMDGYDDDGRYWEIYF